MFGTKKRLSNTPMSELDRHILRVQKSTKTRFKWAASRHEKLRQKYRWYYKWHLNPWHTLTHWITALAGSATLIILIFTLVFDSAFRAEAAVLTWDMNTPGNYTAGTGVEFNDLGSGNQQAQLTATQNYTPNTDWIATSNSKNWQYRKPITIKNDPATNGLVGYWQLNETSGTAVADSTGTSSNGTATNVTWNTATPRYGAASATFAGNGGIDLGNNANLQLKSAFTISGWINASTGTGWRVIANKQSADNNRNFWIGLSTGYEGVSEGALDCRYSIGGTDTTRTHSTTILDNGSWYHFAIVYNGTTISTFINGTKEHSATQGNPDVQTSTLSLGKQATAMTNNFTGDIDEIRIYKIITLWSAKLPQSTA